MRQDFLWRISFALIVGFIFFISVFSLKDYVVIPYVNDKHIHFAVYAVLAFYWGLLYKQRAGLPDGQAIGLAIVFAFMLGLLMEMIQIFVPGRHFDIFDLVANGAGCVVGSVFGVFVGGGFRE